MAGAGAVLGLLPVPADGDDDEDGDDGECPPDGEELIVGSAVVADDCVDDELGADEPVPDAGEPIPAAASGVDPPPLEHPATARTAATATTSLRIAPPLAPDTAMLIASRHKGLGIGHPA